MDLAIGEAKFFLTEENVHIISMQENQTEKWNLVGKIICFEYLSIQRAING